MMMRNKVRLGLQVRSPVLVPTNQLRKPCHVAKLQRAEQPCGPNGTFALPIEGLAGRKSQADFSLTRTADPCLAA
jgi:hypothetical protein